MTTHMSMRTGRVLAGSAALLVLSCGFLSCGEPGPVLDVTARRTATRPTSPVVPGATPLQRFQPRQAQDESSDNVIAYDLPEGWRAVAPTSERYVNLRPAGDPEAECYLSFLPGSGGGLVENVNRWRGQLGAAPLSAGEIAALPTAPLLGREATVVEVEGTFQGMGQSAPRAGFKLLGLVISEPSGSLFLKFTAPAGLVERERERFFAFAGSLRLSDDHGAGSVADVEDEHAGHDHGPEGDDHGAEAAATERSASGLSWKSPEGWKRGAPRAMREVTFDFGQGAECYVTRLVGSAGGLRGNLDRWSDQVGRGPLSDAAFQALPRVTMLGQAVPVLELTGTFTGMDGQSRAGQGLLGVACIREEDSLFVKFTGPEELVRAERENFLAFVRSLEEP